MKTWYRAVCDKHKSMCHVLVTNPSCTAGYLSKHDRDIQAWLSRHFGCSLRLAYTDEELEALLGVYEDAVPLCKA